MKRHVVMIYGIGWARNSGFHFNSHMFNSDITDLYPAARNIIVQPVVIPKKGICAKTDAMPLSSKSRSIWNNAVLGSVILDDADRLSVEPYSSPPPSIAVTFDEEQDAENFYVVCAKYSLDVDSPLEMEIISPENKVCCICGDTAINAQSTDCGPTQFLCAKENCRLQFKHIHKGLSE